MDSIKEIWSETMEIPGAGWVIGIAGLIILLLIAYYVVKLFRDMALGETPSEPSEYIGEFRRLRDEGKLDGEEYERLTQAVSNENKETIEERPNKPRPLTLKEHAELKAAAAKQSDGIPDEATESADEAETSQEEDNETNGTTDEYT